MSFFYKYVELRDEDDVDEGSKGGSPSDKGFPHNESSALVNNGNTGGGLAERRATYTESEGENLFDKDGLSDAGTRSESEF